jgi:carbonic anhydrase/acetyltransferase-like protein (isoleucine patch superfamily)
VKSPHIPTPKIHPTALVAPGAQVHGDVVVERDVFVLFGAVIRAELDRIVIGAESNVQDNAVLHCDEGLPCVVGSRVTIGHLAVVHAAEVGDHALIGIGAKALNRTTIGEGAWLAAGSILTEGQTVPPWTLAMGTPARPIRELTEEEILRASEGVDHYLEAAARYREIFG